MVNWQRQCFSYHPIIGRWFIPRLNALIPHERGSYRVRTNSLGMRANREYNHQKPSGIRRLILLGNSYTAGDGVNNEERFSDLIEKSDSSLEVLNFGLPNSGTDQQYLVYKTLAKEFETDAYIFTPLIENIGRNKCRYRLATDRMTGEVYHVPKPYYKLDNNLVLHHQPVPRKQILTRIAPLDVIRHTDFVGKKYQLRSFINKYLPFLKPHLLRWIKRHPYPDYINPDQMGWKLMSAILQQFIKYADVGKPIFIIPLPTYHYIESNLPPIYLKRFREIESKLEDVYVCDLLPYFHRLSLKDRRACRFQHDVHYSPYGHQIVADAIYQEIERKLPNFWNIV